MAFEYSGLRDSAASLIGNFGRSMTLRKMTGASYNPATSEAVLTSADHTITAVFQSTKRGRGEASSTTDESKTLLVASKDLSVVPEVSDRIVDGSTTYQIVGVEEIKPGPSSLLFALRVTK